MVQWSKFSSASQKQVLVFLFKWIVHEKHKGQTLKLNFPGTSASANKIRLGVLILDGKRAWHVWNFFHMANACFYVHIPGQLLTGISICGSPKHEHLTLNIGNSFLFQYHHRDGNYNPFSLLGLTLLPAENLPNSYISTFDASLYHTKKLYACLEYCSIYCKNTAQGVVLYFTKMQMMHHLLPHEAFCVEKAPSPGAIPGAKPKSSAG